MSLCIYLVCDIFDAIRFFHRLIWPFLLMTTWQPCFSDVCLYAYLVAKPAHKFGPASHLTLSEQQYFVFDTASQKHKMTRNARNLGEMVSLGICLRLCSYPCVFFGEESCAGLRNNYLFSTFNLFCMVKWP